MTPSRILGVVGAVGLSVVVLAGCVAKSDAAASDALVVNATDSACDVSSVTATSGTLAFDVTNAGCPLAGAAAVPDQGRGALDAVRAGRREGAGFEVIPEDVRYPFHGFMLAPGDVPVWSGPPEPQN